VPEALRRCVGSEPFGDEYWGLRPMLRRSAGFADLLGLDAVDELLSDRGLRTPFVRVVRDGCVQPASAFTGGGGLGAEMTDQVRDDLLMRLLSEGATVVLQGLHRTWPPLRDFCADLAASLGCAVQANAYLTPGGNTGLATHYDTHDVFVLQIAGTKHWRVHEPVLLDPLERQAWGGRAEEVAAQAEGSPVLEHVMAPGDVLYLPRGWLHAASALDGISLHVTLGLHRPTRFSIVEALLNLAAGDQPLRGGLPLGVDVSDPAELGPHLQGTVARLRDWLATVDAETVAQRLRAPHWTATRPGPVRPVAQVAFAASVGLDDRIVLRTGLRFTFDGTRLQLTGKTLTFPAACSDAVALILEGKPVRVGDLPGLDDPSRLVLARRLLLEAIAVPEVYEPPPAGRYRPSPNSPSNRWRQP
jgi:bifunctional lysine-specific demethylase and histidyl-hydroxylase NO66